MRLVTWNVWARFGDNPDARQEPIAQTLSDLDPDVVCLQETYITADGDDQAARLAARLGMNHVRVPMKPHREGGWGMGNAILSKGEITDHQVHSLAIGKEAKRRTALVAHITRGEHQLRVVCTHLDHFFHNSRVRIAQVEMISEVVASLRVDEGYPVLLAGDFNATANSDEIRTLTGERAPAVEGLTMNDAWPQRSDQPGFTWCATNPYLAEAMWPNRRIDFVFIECPREAPLGNVKAVALAGNQALGGVMPSDHYAVVADLVD